MSITLINPYAFNVRYFQDAAYTAATSALPQQLASAGTFKTLNTVETSDRNYAIFWHAIMTNPSLTTSGLLRLFESPNVRQAQIMESQEGTTPIDAHSMGGAYCYAGGSAKTFTISGYEDTATNANMTIGNYSLSLLELHGSDLYQTDTTESTTTSATYQTKCSVTVDREGDYLIIGSASLRSDTAGAGKYRIFDGTNEHFIHTPIYRKDVLNYMPFWAVKELNLTAGQTISLQYGSNGTATSRMREATLIALRLDEFAQYHYAEQMTEQTTTTTTAFGATSLAGTFTVNTQNYHILLAANQLRHGATNSSVRSRLFNNTDSTDYAGTHAREAANNADYMPTVVCRLVTFANATNTIDWDYYVEANTGRMKDISIALLDTGVPI